MTDDASQQGGANLPWQIEANGINVVAEADRSGRLRDLFWIWFAANIGILAVLYGAIILSFGLNFAQGVAVALLGSLSFILVGIFSVSGRDGGVPMLTLSRAIFGPVGNLLPTAVSWLSLVGWEAISVITGTLAMMALLGSYWKTGTVALALISMIIVAGLVVALGLLGQATLVLVQTWASYIFGALTLLVAIFLVSGTHWTVLLTKPMGPWLTGFVPALTIIIAGTGLSWANASADYSRYMPRHSSTWGIVWSTTLGALIPVSLLMMVGLLLATREPTLATSANPIAVIQGALPGWMAAPFLITAVVGLIVEGDLSLYSSGLNLLNMFVPLERYKTVVIDGAIMIVGTVYVVLVARNFFGPFESFLLLLGVGLAAWAGIFLSDQAFLRSRLGGYHPELLYDPNLSLGLIQRGWNPAAVTAWIVGVVVALLFTVSPFFQGPLATGIFATSSLELLIAFVVSGLIFTIWSLLPGSQHDREPTIATGPPTALR